MASTSTTASTGVTLSDPRLFRQSCYIDGAWTRAQSGATISVDNPATGEVIGTVPKLGAAETRAAIESADRALPAWRKKTAKERAAVVRRWYELMLQHQEDLARLMTTEQGKVLAMLDSEDQQDAVRKAEANLFAARANLDNAIANRDRTQGLYPRTATRQALDAAIAQANTAQASVDAAQAALRVANNNLDNRVVKANAAGVVHAVGGCAPPAPGPAERLALRGRYQQCAQAAEAVRAHHAEGGQFRQRVLHLGPEQAGAGHDVVEERGAVLADEIGDRLGLPGNRGQCVLLRERPPRGDVAARKERDGRRFDGAGAPRHAIGPGAAVAVPQADPRRATGAAGVIEPAAAVR